MTRRGTILPSLPPLPDDHLVSVCAFCRRRSCVLARNYRHYCQARRDNPHTNTEQIPLARLRELALEHPSYWRAEEGDDPDMPKSIEDVKELAEHQRARHHNEPELFAGYLTEQLGLDQAQCRDVLAGVWPEASAAIAKWMQPAGGPT